MVLISMDDLIDRIRPYFRETILKRGWDYYLSDAVEELHTEGTAVIRATVFGSERYRVRIHLDAFPSSTCDCPYDDYCKHMAAVLFAACAEAGLQPDLFLAPIWMGEGDTGTGSTGHAASGKREMAAASRAAADRTATREAKTAGRRRVTLPKETGSVAEWHGYFQKRFGNHPYYGASFLDLLCLQIKNELLPFAQSWNATIRLLYHLHVNLFLLSLCDQFYQEYSTRYSIYFDELHSYKSLSAKCVEEIIQILNELDREEARRLYGQHLSETARFLAEKTFSGQPTPSDWMSVYRFVWWSLLHEPSWIEAERLRLQTELENPGLSPVRKDRLVAGLWGGPLGNIAPTRSPGCSRWSTNCGRKATSV